jgi:protein-tyrosine-phosphatase
MADNHPNVLFLCTGNSARSILAEALLRQLGAGRFNAFSAGSKPTGAVNPLSLQVLEKYGHDIRFARSKSWDEFAGAHGPKMDFIFTVCGNAAAEICPIWPGHPVSAHWGVPDPAAATGMPEIRLKAFVSAYEILQHRVKVFVNLPFDELTSTEIDDWLTIIGKM